MTMSSRQGRAGGLENEDTLSELAARFGVHPATITASSRALPDDLIPVFQQPATLCFFVKPVDGLCMPLAPAGECRKASRVPIAIFIITPIDILI